MKEALDNWPWVNYQGICTNGEKRKETGIKRDRYRERETENEEEFNFKTRYIIHKLRIFLT